MYQQEGKLFTNMKEAKRYNRNKAVKAWFVSKASEFFIGLSTGVAIAWTAYASWLIGQMPK
jgi:hypothetical protein